LGVVIYSADDGDTDGVDNTDWHVYNGLDMFRISSFFPVIFTFLVAAAYIMRVVIVLIVVTLMVVMVIMEIKMMMMMMIVIMKMIMIHAD
jgi:hypothetical protein